MEQASTAEPIEGFQVRGQAWDPYRPDVPELLARSRHQAIVPIYYGSNHCFLLTLAGAGAGRSLAVYKPARGEYPLYDFPSGTLYRREVGSWLLSALLDWSLVPPTVVTQGKYGVGSLQLFIESYPEGQVEVGELQRLALLDVLLNNADRKSDHLLLAEGGKLWGIDHGLTFHVQGKLRTVLWHFAGSRITDAQRSDLERLEISLRQCMDPRAKRLRELISGGEWRALLERLVRLLESGRFPDPRYKAVPYRW